MFDEDGVEFDPTQDEVTWCKDKINESDVEYVLASDVAAELEQLRAELSLLQKAVTKDIVAWDAMGRQLAAQQVVIDEARVALYDVYLNRSTGSYKKVSDWLNAHPEVEK
jgi:hypothetical protein